MLYQKAYKNVYQLLKVIFSCSKEVSYSKEVRIYSPHLLLDFMCILFLFSHCTRSLFHVLHFEFIKSIYLWWDNTIIWFPLVSGKLFQSRLRLILSRWLDDWISSLIGQLFVKRPLIGWHRTRLSEEGCDVFCKSSYSSLRG